MSVEPLFRNPKRYVITRKGRSSWYGYYACYSVEFVEDVLTSINLDPEGIVLDPWNGSGTTTYTAETLGFQSVGFDINPVMVVVAKAQSVESRKVLEFGALSRKIVREAEKQIENVDIGSDPLSLWLKPESTRMWRALEQSIQQVFFGKTRVDFTKSDLSEIPESAAFFYIALFRAFRKTLGNLTSSNPTWFKEPEDKRSRIGPGSGKIKQLFENAVQEMIASDNQNGCAQTLQRVSNKSLIARCPSWDLPLERHSIDAVIASPPYCTRIDYAIATKPELLLLGVKEEYFLGLRNLMIGSPTIKPLIPEIHEDWGNTCISFLADIQKHTAKASATYYLKNHLQYFDAIYRSLCELDRTIKPGGHCTLVVQDSFYKDIHNNLPTIFHEMTNSFGWKLNWSKEFRSGRTLAQINGARKKYGTIAKRTETTLLFQKER